MFVVLFMVIVAIELVCKAMHEKLECGHYKKTDVEDVDPAALVGTFKRYKWNKIAAGKLIAIIFSGGESTSKCDVKLFHFKENWSHVYEIIDMIFIKEQFRKYLNFHYRKRQSLHRMDNLSK